MRTRMPFLPAIALLLTTLLLTPAAETRAAITVPPTLNNPADGETVPTLGPTLAWATMPDVTQYQLQVFPAGGDGPGIDLHVGSVNPNALETAYHIPAPPRWYGLLPDMTYTWRVRVSDAPQTAGNSDPSWSPWAERRFRTPPATSDSVFALTPVRGDTVATTTPTLQWGNERRDIYYYEIQVSRDAGFNTDPATAAAPIHWLLLHGGTTTPLNSYAIPTTSRLDDGTTYHWRVRPRVQGDARPLPWSSPFSFRVQTSARPAVAVDRVSVGLNQPDALCEVRPVLTTLQSTPVLTGVYAAVRYAGEGAVVRNVYLNDRPFAAFKPDSLPAGTCFRSTVGTPGGGPDAGYPLPPGSYRLELWHARQRAGVTAFTVSPAAEFGVGPITVGTGQADAATCRLSGAGTLFPPALPAIWFRFNYVGSGSFSVEIIRDITRVARTGEIRLPAHTVAGCIDDLPYSPPRGFVPGDYRILILVDGDAVQEGRFTIR